MRPRYFRYQTDARGRVVLPGLTPDETLEFEMLANQVGDLRARPQHLRLEALCDKHRSFVCAPGRPEAADIFARYPSPSPGLAAEASLPVASPLTSLPVVAATESPSCVQLEFAFDPFGANLDAGMTYSYSSG